MNSAKVVREVVRVLSGGRESGNLGRYLQRNPLFTNQFSAGPTVDFRIPGSPTIGHYLILWNSYLLRSLQARL